MTKIEQGLILGIVFCLGGVVGSYTQKNVSESETKQTTQTDTVTQIRRVIVKKKNRGVEETTTTEDITKTKKKETEKQQTVRIETVPPKTSIQALVGFNYSQSFEPVYGVNISRQIIGPVSIGAWGLTDKTVGVSIGFTF